jgi:murein L,D-transpeptidase YcbB/YkuD
LIQNSYIRSFIAACMLIMSLVTSASADLRSTLANTSIEGSPLLAPLASRAFYAKRLYAPVWTNQPQRLEQLRAAISSATEQGLSPANYHQEILQSARGDALEVLATDAWLALAANIVGGQLNPVTIEPDWTAARRERDLVSALEQAIASNRIVDALRDLEPNAPNYTALKTALKTLRERENFDNSAPITAGAALKLGMTSTRIPALRQKLAKRGFDVGDSQSEFYDPDLLATVIAFQRASSLADDGIVGAATLRLLNMTDQDRQQQLIVNMERWRWLPEDLGERHIRVNIANYNLEARNRGVVERTHQVIVGRDYRQTPVFSNNIRYMIVNPWWETPSSIARKDKIPAFQQNPEKVRELGFDVLDRDGNLLDSDKINWGAYSTNYFPLRLRQRPGPLNALGQVKIMFPNPHDVYLHDTASRELFAKTDRAFSSGCVRVQNALELAKWLLEKNPDHDLTSIASVAASGKETRINMVKPVPVHILYFTVIIDANGKPVYLNDLYNRDQRVAKALEG